VPKIKKVRLPYCVKCLKMKRKNPSRAKLNLKGVGDLCSRHFKSEFKRIKEEKEVTA
jgi:hypothetical protein